MSVVHRPSDAETRRARRRVRLPFFLFMRALEKYAARYKKMRARARLRSWDTLYAELFAVRYVGATRHDVIECRHHNAAMSRRSLRAHNAAPQRHVAPPSSFRRLFHAVRKSAAAATPSARNKRQNRLVGWVRSRHAALPRDIRCCVAP